MKFRIETKTGKAWYEELAVAMYWIRLYREFYPELDATIWVQANSRHGHNVNTAVPLEVAA